MDRYAIRRLAQAADVGIDPVRFHERARLMPPPPRRTPAGYRIYGDSDPARLRFIRRAKTLARRTT